MAAPTSTGTAVGAAAGAAAGTTALTENARRVLAARYLRAGETPEELFARVARAVAEAELQRHDARTARRWEEVFFEVLGALEFLPNSPTLMNAGARRAQLSACFVLPVEDSLEEIFRSLSQAALIQRTGGGTGFSFSHLRPEGDPLSTGGRAAGPVSFMRVFDCMTEQVKHAGRRRGANMGILRVDHPDVLTFIDAKRDEGSLRNFNLSVAVPDAFMHAVRAGAAWSLVHPKTGAVVRALPAAELFEAIVDAAWRTGDPGLVFVDAIARGNPAPALGPIEATNPCGEIPLLPWESCNLGSINLARMLRPGARGVPELDEEKLRRTARIGVRFLDDVIEVNHPVLAEAERAMRATRKIGLGVMGLAEVLIRMGIPYDSREALRLADRIMAVVADEALLASRELARERGPFAAFDRSRLAAEGVPVRNATRTAIAPTGTLSILAGTTPSIEPLFALAYRRSHVLESGDREGATLVEENPFVVAALAEAGVDPQRVLAAIAAGARLADLDFVPDAVRRTLRTALEMPPQAHLSMQAAFQRHVDNAVSKTINLPQEATRDDVRTAYSLAHELGLKGITIFRSGSRGAQVYELGPADDSLVVENAPRCDSGECRL